MTRAGNGTTDPAPETVRCFVAAFLTERSARILRTLAEGTLAPGTMTSRAARPVPSENYHVTLKFLGDIDAAGIERALDAVAAISGSGGSSARVAGFVGFPRPRACRLVAAELLPHPGLEAWWRALGDRLGADDRPFRPHVTVLRLRHPQRFRAVPVTERMALELTAPRLYRSDQTPAGVRYKPVPASG